MNRFARWGFTLAILPVAACSTPTPPPVVAPPPPPALSAADQAFIQTVAASDAFEAQSSQLAQDKAGRPAIKTFASKMIQEHGKTTQQLQGIVQSKTATPPSAELTADQQAMLTTLQGESGAKFDRDYVRFQIQSHQAAVAAFQQEADGGTDADLRSFAQQTLPELQQHLAEARRLSTARAPAPRHHR